MALLSFDEALDRLLQQARPVTEQVGLAVESAWGRVLAQAITASFDVPDFDNAAMDGYALRYADLAGPGCTLPVSQRIAAGDSPSALQAGTAARIFTGAPIPQGADTVVMQENCVAEGSDTVRIVQRPRAGESVRRAGEDIRAGSTVLAAGTRLTPARLGLIASLGQPRVHVVRPLRVAIFFTGDELLTPGDALLPGRIYNSNRYVLRGTLAACGAEVHDLGNIPDDLGQTRSALRQAAAAGVDLILTSGGMSEGEEDHVRHAVELEGQIDLWKIAMKPGKPHAFGRVGEAHFIGLPGNPVATWVGLQCLVLPFMRRCQGMHKLAPQALRLPAAFDRPRPGNRREFLRARLCAGAVELFPNQSSAALSSAAWAEGLADIPADTPIARGDLVDFLPLTDADFA